jgi:Arc/MetJ-type ribon-helix-helix transcriptional regulator
MCHDVTTMRKMMVYLPDEMHEGLRHLAFERRTSIADLIRRAVEAAYGEILEDIRDMEAEIASYLEDPSSSVSLDEFVAQRRLRVSGRAKAARSA